jgi:hypothetical protein
MDKPDDHAGPQSMPMLKNGGAHRHAVARIARIPASSRRRAAPTAAAIVTSKMSSSLSPAALSRAKSVSVMRYDWSRSRVAYEPTGSGSSPRVPAAPEQPA